MRKMIGVFILAMLSHTASAEIFLEGISILGSKRSAFVSEKGQKYSVVPGDKLGEWVVVKIQNRSITLRGKDGKLKDLPLHTTLASETPKAEDDEAEASKFEPRVIDDEEVPAGYKKVTTPFGDILVQSGEPVEREGLEVDEDDPNYDSHDD